MSHAKPAAGNAEHEARVVPWSYFAILRVTAPAMLALFVDQMGFAFMFPTLPSYLAEHMLVRKNTTTAAEYTESDVERWVGIILACQFLGNALGSLVIGRICDLKSSQLALQVSMAFDAVFFGLSATPYVHPGLLLAIRFFVGFSSPLTAGATYMFDRLPPECVPKAISLFASFILSAYACGNFLVGTIHSTVGWTGESFLSCALALLALVYLAIGATPSNRQGPQPTPQGAGRALRSPEVVSGVSTMLLFGFAYSTKYTLSILRWETHFGVSAEMIGLLLLPVPVIMLLCNLTGPFLIERFGLYANVSCATIAYLLCCVLMSLPPVLDNMIPFTLLTLADWVPFIFALNPNNAKPPSIAAKYTLNGLGFVTGVFQFGYALGQAFGPFVAVLLYQAAAWVPWATLAALAVACLAIHRAVGLAFFSDPPLASTSIELAVTTSSAVEGEGARNATAPATDVC